MNMHWQKIKLAKIAEITAGQGAPQSASDFDNSGLPFVRAGSLAALVKGGKEGDCERVTKEAAQKNKLRLFSPGTVLFAKSGMSAKLDRIYQLKSSAYVVNHLAAVIPTEKCDASFLLRWLQANPPSRLIKDDAYPSIRLSDIEDIEIPLPPIDEQRRIAAILDKADAIRRKRQESIRLTEEFLRSTFLEMFGDPETNPKGWESIKLEQICSKITDGTHKTPTYVESGVIFISAKNIKKYRLDWNDVKYITSEEHEFLTKRCKAEFGDILLSKSGSIGAAAKVRVIYEFSLFESLALIKYIRNKVNGDYLQHYLNSDHMKRRYVSDTKGLAIRHLHLNEIRNIDVLLPPINLQNQFSEIINTVESASAKQVSTNCSLNELFKSLTQRAFRGEL